MTQSEGNVASNDERCQFTNISKTISPFVARVHSMSFHVSPDNTARCDTESMRMDSVSQRARQADGIYLPMATIIVR